MKKTFLVIVGLLAMTGMYVPANAQDTLQIRWPLSTYFSYQWPQSYYDNYDTFRTVLSYWGSYIFNNDIAYYMFTEDSLTIYGVAACLISKKDHDGSLIYANDYVDTTYKDVYDYLRVYEAGNGELVTLGEAKAHMHVTPIAYYLDMNAYKQYNNYRHPVLPMYECYFANPVTVVDSFYVGRHEHAHRYVQSQGYRATTMEIFHVTTRSCYQDSLVQPYAIYTSHGPDTSHFEWSYVTIPPYYYEMLSYIPRMFPIIEPGPGIDTNDVGGDTTVVGGDTNITGSDTIAMGDTLIVCDTTIIGGDTIVNYDTILTIGQADLLQRFTGVMPNPAAERARVVSSFGMSMVKVYNASGALVHTQRADGLYVDLDVSRWPAGTYLVRIHTPQGIATKRLVVGR